MKTRLIAQMCIVFALVALGIAASGCEGTKTYTIQLVVRDPSGQPMAGISAQFCGTVIASESSASSTGTNTNTCSSSSSLKTDSQCIDITTAADGTYMDDETYPISGGQTTVFVKLVYNGFSYAGDTQINGDTLNATFVVPATTPIVLAP